MYNEEQKQAFMRDFSDNITIVTFGYKLFNAIEPYEREWGTDLCTIERERLQPVVEKFCGIRNSSKSLPMYILRGYAKWCLDKGLPGARRDLLDIKELSEEKMRFQMIRLPTQLQEYLNALFDKEELETNDNTIRTYLWLCFAGMMEEDIANVTTKNVDLKNKRILYNGAEYTLPPESIQAITNVTKLKSFAFYNISYVNGPTRRNRVDGDILLRGVRAVPDMYYFRTAISRRSKAAVQSGKTKYELTPYRVWLSGVFYRKWVAEQSGQRPDFTAEAKIELSKNAANAKSTTPLRPSALQDKIHGFNVDYQRWKKTFV